MISARLARSMLHSAPGASLGGLVECLFEASHKGVAASTPEPELVQLAGIGAAYEVQALVTEKLVAAGHNLVGWKIGAANEQTQRRLGLASPFYGPVFDRDVHPSPAMLPSPLGFTLVGVEAELVFALREDLPPRDTDYTLAEVLRALEWVAPAVEVCGSRFATRPKSAYLNIADQASHGALVVAQQLRWPAQRWGELEARGGFAADWARVALSGVQVASGSPAQVLGRPLAAVAWLANTLADNAAGGGPLVYLREGQLVSSGTMTGMAAAGGAHAVVADFDGMGRVRVELPAA